MTPDVRETMRLRLPDFLLAEREHVAESLLRNEESGEKRATFFVSIVGAAAAVLAFAFGGDRSIVPRADVPAAAAASSILLLAFGILTVRRLIERHIVTDRYLFALRSLRRAFVTPDDVKAFPNAFFNLYEPFEPRKVSAISVGKGGWLETVALINAVLAALAAATALRATGSPWAWMWAAPTALAATWLIQISYARRKLAKNVAGLSASERCTARN